MDRTDAVTSCVSVPSASVAFKENCVRYNAQVITLFCWEEVKYNRNLASLYPPHRTDNGNRQQRLNWSLSYDAGRRGVLKMTRRMSVKIPVPTVAMRWKIATVLETYYFR